MVSRARNGGVRRYQNRDGSLTDEGKKRYTMYLDEPMRTSKTKQEAVNKASRKYNHVTSVQNLAIGAGMAVASAAAVATTGMALAPTLLAVINVAPQVVNASRREAGRIAVMKTINKEFK